MQVANNCRQPDGFEVATEQWHATWSDALEAWLGSRPPRHASDTLTHGRLNPGGPPSQSERPFVLFAAALMVSLVVMGSVDTVRGRVSLANEVRRSPSAWST